MARLTRDDKESIGGSLCAQTSYDPKHLQLFVGEPHPRCGAVELLLIVCKEIETNPQNIR